MKKIPSRVAVFLVILALGLTGCSGQMVQSVPASTPTIMPSPEPKPETASGIVQEMVARMNAGDVDGSLAYFADDAVAYIVGLPPTGMEVYAGKEQIRALWQDSVVNHFQWEVNITSTVGNIVNVQAKTWHDFTRQLGVAPLEYNDVYEVRDGKITTYGTTITADALARFMPALAEVMPVEEPAVPSTEQPASDLTITISDGTCTYEGSMNLKAGQINVTVNVHDQDKTDYAITFFTLDLGKDILDLMAATVQPEPPSWSNMFSIVEVGPGTSKSYSFTAEEGPIYMICWSKPPDLPIGNAGPIEVIDSETSADAEAPSLAVSVDDLLGKWKTYCPPAHESCTWEFRSDNTYSGALISIPGAVLSEKFTFQNGLLTFETDTGLCAGMPQATYEVYVVKQNGKNVELQFKVVGEDVCKDRRLSFVKVKPYEQ
jgi:hypothetical protein